MKVFIYVADKILQGEFGIYKAAIADVNNKEECLSKMREVINSLYNTGNSTLYKGYNFNSFERELVDCKIWQVADKWKPNGWETSVDFLGSSEELNDFVQSYCFPVEGIDNIFPLEVKRYLLVMTSDGCSQSAELVVEASSTEEIEKAATRELLSLFKRVYPNLLSGVKTFMEFSHISCGFVKKEFLEVPADKLQAAARNLGGKLAINTFCYVIKKIR